MSDPTLPNSPSHSEDQMPAAGESQQERPREGAGVRWLRVSGKEEQRKLLFLSQPRDRDQAQGRVRGIGTFSHLLPAPSTTPPCLLPCSQPLSCPRLSYPPWLQGRHHVPCCRDSKETLEERPSGCEHVGGRLFSLILSPTWIHAWAFS